MASYKGKEKAYADQWSNQPGGRDHDVPFVIKTMDDFINAEVEHTLKVWYGRINHTPRKRYKNLDWAKFSMV